MREARRLIIEELPAIKSTSLTGSDHMTSGGVVMETNGWFWCRNMAKYMDVCIKNQLSVGFYILVL